MRNIMLTVAYDGSGYHGFQKQKNVRTVQNVLEEVLGRLCGEPVATAASGRTDAGVHALAQTVTFATNGSIPCANIVRAAKRMLPPDIVITEAEETAADFHARYSAQWKRYQYKILCGRKNNDPLQARYAWQMAEDLNLDVMNSAAALLLGTHDFSAFRSSGSVEGSPVKTIYEANWRRQGEALIFTISGDGFLYHMVRNIVWTLVQIGLGRREAASLAEELKAKRCAYLNSPAPAQGLYLAQVFYEPYAFLETKRLYLRKLRQEDFSAAKNILQDPEVMYAWEHVFSDAEVRDFIEQHIRRYADDGFSYLAAIDKASGALAGFIGPLMEEINGVKVPGVAYILAKKYWGIGLACEGACVCAMYLQRRGYEKIVAEIRPENTPSRRLAERLGFKAEGEIIKTYRGKKMPHLLYYLEKNFS